MATVPTRRYRTAKRIQETAVELAVQNGLANTTTEAIAREAGISTRSFFNYYPYKEAAIMGPLPHYPKDAAEKFVISRGVLLEDLKVLIATHLRRFEAERDMIAHILTLAADDPKLDALRGSAILARRVEMRDLLTRRMPAGKEVHIEILSASIIATTNIAVHHWAQRKIEDLVGATHKYLDMIGSSATLLEKPASN
ncbi:TetR family transcriptional regulator [Paracoccus sp. 11-3]|uniref:TetR family transcriptional regulator n=1 Tax=Paracoccus amoyensis TaxID=2760093 RepID=A0A926G779_9RHOB|nr:TetR/AcrR family transcriptional regulator [Paracoccus amoyensis]MBC9245763.1 TetR family transcriptional regulator [Paracoccus amoyensis]